MSSWLSDRLGIHLGNIGAPIGAAIGSVIPGVGTTLGAALGQGLGSLGQGKSLGQAALSGAGTYAGAALAGPLLGKIGDAAGQIPGAGTVASLGSKVSGLLGLGGGTGGVALPNVDLGALNAGALQAAGMGGSASAGSGGAPNFLQQAIGTFLGGGAASGTPGGGGMTTAEKLQLLQAGLGTLGGAATSVMQNNQATAARAEQQREFNATNQLAQQQLQLAQQRAAQSAPLRGAAVTALQGMLAHPATAFRPHDIFTPGGDGPGQQPTFPAFGGTPAPVPAAANPAGHWAQNPLLAARVRALTGAPVQ